MGMQDIGEKNERRRKDKVQRVGGIQSLWPREETRVMRATRRMARRDPPEDYQPFLFFSVQISLFAASSKYLLQQQKKLHPQKKEKKD